MRTRKLKQGFREAEPSGLLRPPPHDIEWAIWNATSSRLLAHARSHTAFAAYTKSALPEPFSEVRCQPIGEVKR